MSALIKTSVPTKEIRDALKTYAKSNGHGSVSRLYEKALIEYLRRHKRKGAEAVLHAWVEGVIDGITDEKMVLLDMEMLNRLIKEAIKKEVQ